MLLEELWQSMGYAHNKVLYLGVHGSWYGDLPKGCVYCMKGSKVVIFVTGICETRCYYCPISSERRRPDAFYVDEEKFKNIAEIVNEVSMVKAEGASITGGEPLQMFYIITTLVRLLKDLFGMKFHIHLYTSGFAVTKEAIKKLSRVGLDEIRFHIVNDTVFKLVEFTVKETTMDVGIEVPAIPNADWLWNIVVKADSVGAKFVNLNEFEVSETNIEEILIRGYRIRDDGRSVEGSHDIALKIIEKASQENLRVSVHLCPAIYKDVVQHRNRLRRKALTCLSPGVLINTDGTIKVSDNDYVPMFNICSDHLML